jgi:chemotaxis signal transduction protein
MPNTPGWLLGLCNRRGDLVPVFDLRTLLGISERTPDKKYLFIVDKGEYASGFFIDNYPASAYSLQPLGKLPAMPELLKDHVITAYEHEQQSLLEIDHRSLFKAITKQLSSAG